MKTEITDKQILDLLMLLSSLETWSFSTKNMLPDHLYDKISSTVDTLTKMLIKQ